MMDRPNLDYESVTWCHATMCPKMGPDYSLDDPEEAASFNLCEDHARQLGIYVPPPDHLKDLNCSVCGAPSPCSKRHPGDRGHDTTFEEYVENKKRRRGMI